MNYKREWYPQIRTKPIYTRIEYLLARSELQVKLDEFELSKA